MDYFSIERLDILKKYNHMYYMVQKLDKLYLNVWKVYLQSISFELLKRNNLLSNTAKMNIMLDKKKANSCAIHEVLNNVICTKLSLCLYNMNKIYLNANEVNKKFKEKATTIKLLAKMKRLMSNDYEEKKVKKLININKSVILFNSLYKKNYNSENVYKKINQCKNNISKYSKQLNTKYNKIDSLNKSISSLEKKCIEAKCGIQNSVKKANKKNKSDLNSIKYLSAEINGIQKSYESEIKNINKTYENEFIKNKKQMCSICLEEDCRFIKTSCGHYFHVECITMYLEKIIYNNNFINITCPMCRQNMG